MRDLNPTLKVGDTVLVDVKYANGGYEAQIVWVGKIFAKIEVADGTQWDIMKDRLTLKENSDETQTQP